MKGHYKLEAMFEHDNPEVIMKRLEELHGLIREQIEGLEGVRWVHPTFQVETTECVPNWGDTDECQ